MRFRKYKELDAQVDCYWQTQEVWRLPHFRNYENLIALLRLMSSVEQSSSGKR
jgi:hypothetical protein